MLALFAIVAAVELVPLFRSREWRCLFFSVPVFLAALTLDILAAFETPYESIFSMLHRMLSNLIK